MGSTHNLSEWERLTLWDNMRFEAFLQTTIFLFLCFPIGVFGNGVVIYIYGFRLHRKYAGRYFIPYLAVADLFAVFISVELHVVNNFYLLRISWKAFVNGTLFLDFMPLCFQHMSFLLSPSSAT